MDKFTSNWKSLHQIGKVYIKLEKFTSNWKSLHQIGKVYIKLEKFTSNCKKIHQIAKFTSLRPLRLQKLDPPLERVTRCECLTYEGLDDGQRHDQDGGQHVGQGERHEEVVEHVLQFALHLDGQAHQDVAGDGHDDDDEEAEHGPVVGRGGRAARSGRPLTAPRRAAQVVGHSLSTVVQHGGNIHPDCRGRSQNHLLSSTSNSFAPWCIIKH